MRNLFIFFLLAVTPVFLIGQISTFPVMYDFESEAQCPTSCFPICPLVGDWQNADSAGLAPADINWTSDRGGTASANTGPSVDHTLGTSSGTYLYLESSCTNGNPQSAELISPYYDFSNLAFPQLSFWFHMWGNGMGTMHVDVDTTRGQGAWLMDVVPAWTDSIDLWKHFVGTFPQFGLRDSVRFRIRGVTGPTFSSDMAIDDIMVGPPPPLDVGVTGTSLLTQSGMGANHPVDVIITSFGTDSLHTGDTVQVCYQINNLSPVCESLVLPRDLGQGDTITYTFSQTANLSALNFNFFAWTAMPLDPIRYNDRFFANIYNFPAGFDCPYMEVTTGVNFFRPCRSSQIVVEACNRGTDTAWAATVVIDLDSHLTYNSPGSGNLLGSSGQSLTFGLGDMAPGQCRNFYFGVGVDCDTLIIGRTLCVDAHVYPDSFCAPPDTSWDRSSLQITGQCIADSLVCFHIQNSGSGNMASPTQWRLYTNTVIDDSGTVQLCAGCDTTLCFTGGGNTLRMEVDQHPLHPGSSFPVAVVEQCGNPNDTTGLVNAQPLDDLDPFVDIFCREVTIAVDPNDKRGYPNGVDQGNHIAETQELTYFIRFQNTGNDTAFLVVIDDTLSPYLDITTVRPGVASHPYQFEMPDNRVLRFRFDNILLPDSGRDEPNSHGFLTFKVQQMPNNPRGTLIENKAGIVFDINAPVVTNTVKHTVGLPIITAQGQAFNSFGQDILLFPNPANDELTLILQEGAPIGAFEVRFFDLNGRQIAQAQGQRGMLRLETGAWPEGLLLYRVQQGGVFVGSGKVLIRH